MAPVSVLVTVTSAPGIAAPLASFTTPEICDPETAWAQPVPAASSDNSTPPTIVRSTFTSAPPDRGRSGRPRACVRFVCRTVAPENHRYYGVTVRLPLQERDRAPGER